MADLKLCDTDAPSSATQPQRADVSPQPPHPPVSQLMVATAGDPRRPGECVQWDPPKVDPDSRPPDFLLLIGAMVGLCGLYMRVRPRPHELPWLGRGTLGRSCPGA